MKKRLQRKLGAEVGNLQRRPSGGRTGNTHIYDEIGGPGGQRLIGDESWKQEIAIISDRNLQF